MHKKLDLMYVLPNLFTAASIFFGVLCILKSAAGEYVSALVFILISLLCDGLDGRVARAINRTSKFGLEFDSLADIIAFGAAPAMLFYFSIGQHFGRVGTVAAAVFVIFGAIRLARFNITTASNEPNVFIGLPIPTAAVVLALWTVVCKEGFNCAGFAGGVVIVCTLALSFLMVSNVRYPSFKKLSFSRHLRIKFLVIAVFICSLIYLYPLAITTAIMSAYVLYGLLRAGYNLFLRKN